MQGRAFVMLAAALTVASATAAGVAAEEKPYSLGVTPLVAQTSPGAPPAAPEAESSSFGGRFFRAYIDSFKPQPESNEPEPPRRALPSPLASPPLPSGEYQGYPLIGVPYSSP